MIIMEATDYGTAPEISIAGPCEVERISAGQVRVSYYTIHHGERRVVAHLIWDYEVFIRSFDLYQHVRREIEAAPLFKAISVPGARAH